jgi:hypothetical protein
MRLFKHEDFSTSGLQCGVKVTLLAAGSPLRTVTDPVEECFETDQILLD